LLIGLRAAIPYGDLVNALRDEKLLSVGAGENVVRLAPPLIVGEAEVAEAVARIDRACAKIESAQKIAGQKGAAG
jgi:acetylornithine/N-succinyldiaminopimelate aminotransferase